MVTAKELVIKVNGTENVEKLADNLDKVEIKMKELPISAKIIAEVLRKGFVDISDDALLHVAKIGAIVGELSAHTEQAINKNKKAAKKLVEEIGQADGWSGKYE